MRYFFISGYIGLTPFDFSVSAEIGYPQRDEIVNFVKDRVNKPGAVVIMNINEMNAEDYDRWNLPLK